MLSGKNSESSRAPPRSSWYMPTLPSPARRIRYVAPGTNAEVDVNCATVTFGSRASAFHAYSRSKGRMAATFTATITPTATAPHARVARLAARASPIGTATTKARTASVAAKFTITVVGAVSANTGERSDTMTAGVASTADRAHQRASLRQSRSQPSATAAATSTMVMGRTMAGCVACATPAASALASGWPRRHSATAASSTAAPQRNGSWPMMGAMTTGGDSSAAAAHHPAPSSGNAQRVAATSATNPRTSTTVTARSPATGHSSAAAVQGGNEYGKARP